VNLLRGIGVSARTLFAHRVRAGLALASIAVSVGAVVVVSAIGTGAKKEIMRQAASMGANLLVVRPAQAKNTAARKQIRGVVTTLTPEDEQAINKLDAVRAAVPGQENTLTVKAGNRSMSVRVLGTTALYLEVCRFQVGEGRFLDDDDSEQARRVAVLGARVDEELFPGQDAIGKDIRVRGVPFEVIGVLKGKGIQADGSDQDNQVIIPIRTALRRVYNVTWLNPVFVSVRDAGQMTAAESGITELLRMRHQVESRRQPDDFSIQNQTKALATQQRIAESLTTLALGLAGVSLIVGGIGILALMLMSVKERTSEIGLRIAVGARPRDILLQFLAEAMMLALAGWVAGLVLGVSAAVTVALLARWTVAISPSMLLASFATVLIAGVGFGTWPARKASLILPIRALQVE
jgi:putative ABC transport system permease protein